MEADDDAGEGVDLRGQFGGLTMRSEYDGGGFSDDDDEVEGSSEMAIPEHLQNLLEEIASDGELEDSENHLQRYRLGSAEKTKE